MAAVADLLDYLGVDERRQLDEALVAVQQRPAPDVEYANAPIRWAVDVLGIPEHTIRWSLSPEYRAHQWDGTPDPLATLAEALAAGDDVGVESGTGTGKTYTVGWVVLWFVAVFHDALVITTAPKEDQLTLQLWKEIGRHWPRFLAAYPKAAKQELRVRMDAEAADRDAWAIIGYACGVDADSESATRAQGFHAEHMLLVTEETPGVPAPVMTAFENTATGVHNLRLSVGNPDDQTDSLHVFCLSPGVRHIRISALDHPNVVTGREVIPGAVTRKAIARRAEKYGETSPLYESRVRGLSPAQSAEALIRKEWVDRAVARYRARETAGTIVGDRALGVDVAQSENGDKAAVARWVGNALVSVTAAQCPNATTLGNDVYAEMKRDGIAAAHVGVDPVGVGAATVNALAGHGAWMVRHLNGGLAPIERTAKAPDGATMEWVPDANNFANLRAQMWWQLREDLRNDRVDLAPSPALEGELVIPRFRIRSGKTLVESKDDIRKRTGGRSPDNADAAVYGNWVRQRRLVEPPSEPISAWNPAVLEAEKERRKVNVTPPGRKVPVDSDWGEW